jgi:hypothetical protein
MSSRPTWLAKRDSVSKIQTQNEKACRLLLPLYSDGARGSLEDRAKSFSRSAQMPSRSLPGTSSSVGCVCVCVCVCARPLSQELLFSESEGQAVGLPSLFQSSDSAGPKRNHTVPLCTRTLLNGNHTLGTASLNDP